MNYDQLRTLYKKEILDVIRDKKTIFTMVVLPILLYPMLFLIAMQVVSFVNSQKEERTYLIAYDHVPEEQSRELNEWMESDEDGLEYLMKEVVSEDPAKDLEKEEIDAYLTVREEEGQVIYEVHYLFSVSNSSAAADMLEEEIQSLAKHIAESNAEAAGLNIKEVLYPVVSEKVDASSDESALGSILGGIVPFLMITSILMGAMYPAIDATAGERERGTLETLLTLPVGNMELIMSKFLSVATLAVISVFANVLSMGLVAAYMFATMSALSESAATIHFGSFVPAILIAIVCVMAFALLMSAVVMCICAFARSFKEANNYVTPVTLVVMLISYIGFIPNVELSATTALIPVANICLLLKALLVFKYDFSMIFIVLMSNVLYSFVAVRILAGLYNSESVLFGESMSGVKLFERRKNLKPGGVPSAPEGFLVFIVAILLLVYLGGLVSLAYPLAGVFVPQLFLAVLPILASFYIKGDMKRIFRLTLPKPKHLLGAVVLMAGTGSVVLLLANLLTSLFPDSSQGVNAEFETILEGIPFWGAVIMIALLPAICEELMFRGYLLTAFQGKMSVVKAGLVVSVLFGFSHMSLIRFLPTMLLGMALALAAYKSGSLVVSGLMHFMNNSVSMFILYYGDKLEFADEATLPMIVAMLFVGVVCVPAGMWLLDVFGSRSTAG